MQVLSACQCAAGAHPVHCMQHPACRNSATVTGCYEKLAATTHAHSQITSTTQYA